jgi:alpha-beta hydrolase superfamily lysophospholipase
VKYPYLVILGEKDTVVDNNATRTWHQHTASGFKKVKMLPGALHELTKEPNSHSVIEAIL